MFYCQRRYPEKTNPQRQRAVYQWLPTAEYEVFEQVDTREHFGVMEGLEKMIKKEMRRW